MKMVWICSCLSQYFKRASFVISNFQTELSMRIFWAPTVSFRPTNLSHGFNSLQNSKYFLPLMQKSPIYLFGCFWIKINQHAIYETGAQEVIFSALSFCVQMLLRLPQSLPRHSDKLLDCIFNFDHTSYRNLWEMFAATVSNNATELFALLEAVYLLCL